MRRTAKVIDTRGNTYEGLSVRRGHRQFAIFREPPSEEFPDGEYVVHRFIPHLFAWLPVKGYRSEAEAVQHINEVFDRIEKAGLEPPTKPIELADLTNGGT